MITYSIGYELTPAQTTIIHDGDHYSEETNTFYRLEELFI